MIAKQLARQAEEASAPYQCVRFKSRNAMLEGLLRMEDGDFPFTSGKMSWEFHRTLHKGRAEGREIPSCLGSSVWGNIALSRPLQADSSRVERLFPVRGVQPCQGLGDACDSRSRVEATCPHPSASGEDANLESRETLSPQVWQN